MCKHLSELKATFSSLPHCLLPSSQPNPEATVVIRWPAVKLPSSRFSILTTVASRSCPQWQCKDLVFCLPYLWGKIDSQLLLLMRKCRHHLISWDLIWMKIVVWNYLQTEGMIILIIQFAVFIKCISIEITIQLNSQIGCFRWSPNPRLKHLIGFRSGFSRREISSVYLWCWWQRTKIERQNSMRNLWIKA